CRQVIADRQAHAVIPPRKNAKPWKDKKMGSLNAMSCFEQLNV
ncbi:tnpA domain protein, partial [Acinetobacter baumannii 24860_4]